MDCPRCGGPVETFQLGDAESKVCQNCEYVGITIDHTPDPSSSESWDEAMERFRGGSPTAADEPPDPVERRVRKLDIPGSGQTVDRRREAIRSMVELLREERRATRSELLRDVDPQAVGYATVESFWSNTGRPGLKALQGVCPPDDGSREWRFEAPAED